MHKKEIKKRLSNLRFSECLQLLDFLINYYLFVQNENFNVYTHIYNNMSIICHKQFLLYVIH